MSAEHVFPTYNRAPIRVERGEGTRLYAEGGETFLDFASGIAVNALGHAHPHLVAALKDQAERLWHVSNLYVVPGQERLGERLAGTTFADQAFFTNSGAEALEMAIKTARRWQHERHKAGHGETDEGGGGRTHVVTFSGAFHGRTLATISAGGNEKYLEGFGPRAPGFINLAFGDHEALKEAAARDDVAAVLVEPVQGEGGLRAVPPQCLRGLREMCDEHGLLLIYDEVQTGVGRTGRLFAHQWVDGAEPDIMAVAKGIGGGFPLGACLATAEVAAAMQPGTHGTTYGGNPLAMAVGNAVLDVVLEEGFLDAVQERAIQLRQGLARLADTHPDIVEELRGEGLLTGVKVRDGASNIEVAAAFRDHHLLTVPAGQNVVRLLPPLNVSADEVAEALATMDEALGAMRGAQAA